MLKSPRSPNAAIIPNLITLGNAVCGFAALMYIAKFQPDDPETLHLLRTAAWLILAGMIFDVFDGRVARITGSTSELGAQLDSLSDLVTFGVAPAALMITMSHTVNPSGQWQKVVWVLGVAYFLGAVLRLARFNVEHDAAEEAHLCFKGMPTPAAAGCIAGLVLVYFWLHAWQSWELKHFAESAPAWVERVEYWITRTLPFLAFLSGYAMVSNRLYYPHVASQLFNRRNSFDSLAYVVFGVTLAVIMIEPVLGFAFVSYLLWTPIKALLGGARQPRKRVVPEAMPSDDRPLS